MPDLSPIPSTQPFGSNRAPRQPLSVELLAVVVSVFFTLVTNHVAWTHALADRAWSDPRTWAFVACLGIAITAVQWLGLLLILTQRTAKPLLALLLLVAAVASYFMQTYAVYLDPSMLRNVMHTDVNEATELWSPALLWHLTWQAALPVWLLWRQPLTVLGWRRAAVRRVLALLAALALFAAVVLVMFQDFAAMARNHREWRFLIAPSNVVYSLSKLGLAGAQASAGPLQPIGSDAALGTTWAGRSKPLLFVVVVGETTRAANWGLSGYARQTTPELAQLDVVNFANVESCGTNTEVSVPCMFSPWGRRDYDEARIRGHQSLLHVLERAKLHVSWLDNQSGCKGVCEGLEARQPPPSATPELCPEGRCYDEALLRGLDASVTTEGANRVVVLHLLGSHGPAYSKRYPPAFRKFEPTCETAELRKCTQEQIVNAYDNSVAYTDHVVASAIRLLQAHEKTHDTALLFVSDHGESLGEHNLYLHGLPYAIAPKEQTQVPMVLWLSSAFKSRFSIEDACLRRIAGRPASHDHLFHTVLGMLDVRTAVYDAEYDLSGPCRPSGDR
jgi:lipid A ethanolaminephosphotransferase